MAEITWTSEELREFDEAIDNSEDLHQVTRIAGRLAIKRIIAEHGREKCDAMFAHLEAERKGRK